MGVETHRPNLPDSRKLLARVAGRARPLIDVSTAAEVLGSDRTRVAKQLARWHAQGFLRRVKRGIYAVVPTAALAQEQVVPDPWVLVPATFRQAYVGGWTAAEHWDLTEQVFTRLLVCTLDRLKRTTMNVAGTEIRARHVPNAWFFATNSVWRDGARVAVSDVHKTIVDLCADPKLGGGIQHVMHCFRAYLRRDDCDAGRLLTYAKRLGSPVALKRLGFLNEAATGPSVLTEECLRSVTLGLATLDSRFPSPRVSKRWQLRLPANWERLLHDD
jgi:predicted transcriptional regulator of viral defense system